LLGLMTGSDQSMPHASSRTDNSDVNCSHGEVPFPSIDAKPSLKSDFVEKLFHAIQPAMGLGAVLAATTR
jgi:hypothetical protein